MGGHLVLVKAILSAIPIYAFMALQPPVWAIKAIDKGRCSFLWKETDSVASGHCLMAWSTVCRLKSFSGLGLRNLHLLGNALRIHWLWLQWTNLFSTWQVLPILANNSELALFQSSLRVRIGNG